MKEKVFKALAIMSVIAFIVCLSADPDKSAVWTIVLGVIISGALSALFINLTEKEKSNDTDRN